MNSPDLPEPAFLKAGRFLLAFAMLGIAATCATHWSFAFQREPVPTSWHDIPALIAINIALLAGTGVMLGSRRFVHWGGVALAAVMVVWIVAFHLPRIVDGREAAWLGAAECLTLATAATLIGFDHSRYRSATAALVRRSAIICFALSLVAFGAAHFIYAQITASMVPAWMPYRLFWAYFTGCAHIAAAVSIVTGILSRLATMLFAIMLGLFSLLVNLPMAIAGHWAGPTTVDLCFAIGLTASALVLAGYVRKLGADQIGQGITG